MDKKYSLTIDEIFYLAEKLITSSMCKKDCYGCMDMEFYTPSCSYKKEKFKKYMEDYEQVQKQVEDFERTPMYIEDCEITIKYVGELEERK